MSGRNTKIPKVEVKLQEMNYITDKIMDFIKSMLFELVTEQNKARVLQKKQEFIQELKKSFIDTLFDDMFATKTNLQWVAIHDIVNLLQSFDNVINEIEKHDFDVEYMKRRQDEILINNMQDFSESWNHRYKKLQDLKNID